ncbi:MAG: DUF2231 domain-containing protein [Gemmatimonadales bacterium]
MDLPMHGYHPMMVHLPLIALIGAVVLDGTQRLQPGGPWRRMASVLWIGGLLGAALAVGTGLWAFGRVDHSGASHALMTSHRNGALLALGLFVVAVIWRTLRPAAWGAVLTGAIAAALLVLAADRGATLVYRHATGIPSDILQGVLVERGVAPAVADSGSVADTLLGTPHTHADGTVERH